MRAIFGKADIFLPSAPIRGLLLKAAVIPAFGRLISIKQV